MLKKRLDELVECGAKCEAAFAYCYAFFSVTDCIIHYVTGLLCRNLIKASSCASCREGLVIPTSISEIPEAVLVNCKTRGGLQHPTRKIFSVMQEAEIQFQKNIDNKSVYELAIDPMIENYNMKLPCQTYKAAIMVQLHSECGSIESRESLACETTQGG